MLTLSRSWVRGLTVGLALGTVLGATTLSHGTSGRGDGTLEARVAVLEALTQNMFRVEEELEGVAGPHLVFEGVNVHVRSGAGVTADGTTGLGNLIIGYNAEPPGTLLSSDRGGSHTLVVGDGHRYSSHSGLVVGLRNTVRAPAASVSGGIDNTASGTGASVSGGELNVASGLRASVSGGVANSAVSQHCWRVSGALNTGC